MTKSTPAIVPASDEFVSNLKVATDREISTFGDGYRTTIDLKLISRIDLLKSQLAEAQARVKEASQEWERMLAACGIDEATEKDAFEKLHAILASRAEGEKR